MTEYQLKLIDFFTKDGRKPEFIEKYWEITPETPLEDILYTYNEMACRGYLIQERGYFLENAHYYSKREAYCFLYPQVLQAAEAPFPSCMLLLYFGPVLPSEETSGFQLR